MIRLIWKKVRKSNSDNFQLDHSVALIQIKTIDLILLGFAAPFLLVYNFVLRFLAMMFGSVQEVTFSILLSLLVITLIAYIFPFLFGFSFYKVIIRKTEKRIIVALPILYLAILLILCLFILSISLSNI